MWSFTVLSESYIIEDISLCDYIAHFLHFYNIYYIIIYIIWLLGLKKIIFCQDLNKYICKVLSLTWRETVHYCLFFWLQSQRLAATITWFQFCVIAALHFKDRVIKLHRRHLWRTEKGEQEMNAVSIQGKPASALCETPEKTEFFRLAESNGKMERWKDGGDKGWHRQGRDGSMWRVRADCSQSVWTDITCDWDFISGNASREMPHAAGLRATAAPYATPAPQHQTHMCAQSG